MSAATQSVSPDQENKKSLSLTDLAKSFEAALASVLLGKPGQVRLATAALLSGQHLLLNDLPGVGKTTLGLALAKTIDGTFGRVQGTPDLLPSDLTGVTVYSQRTEEWTFRPGPLFSNVVLMDELNRITPRSQSALLEAMAEGHVTVDGVSRSLPDPFMVVATMNPAGSAGTFPLTAAQLDRFGLVLSLGKPDRDVQKQLLRGGGGAHACDVLKPVMTAPSLINFRAHVALIKVSEPLLDYTLDLCEALRGQGHLSARAPHAVLALARVLAVLSGRSYVIPDDIKQLAIPALSHRLGTEGETVDARVPAVVAALDQVAVPAATG